MCIWGGGSFILFLITIFFIFYSYFFYFVFSISYLHFISKKEGRSHWLSFTVKKFKSKRLLQVHHLPQTTVHLIFLLWYFLIVKLKLKGKYQILKKDKKLSIDQNRLTQSLPHLHLADFCNVYILQFVYLFVCFQNIH